MTKIKVLQVGLGPIGQFTVEYIASKSHLDLVGVVDPHPDLAGRDLQQLCSFPSKPDIIVSPNIQAALAQSRPDVALVTTVSNFSACADTLAQGNRMKFFTRNRHCFFWPNPSTVSI